MDNILKSVKKIIGIQESFDLYDSDLIMHINSVFVILNQLGVGSKDIFSIDKDTEWTDFYTSNNLNILKSYMALKVKLLFDPPLSGIAVESLKNNVSELEWRLFIDQETAYNENSIFRTSRCKRTEMGRSKK